MKNSWTEEDKKNAKEFWQQGLSYKQIGEKIGRSRGSIAKMIYTFKEEFGIRRLKKPSIFWTKEVHDKAVELWLNDESIQAIADAIDCERRKVSSYMSKNRKDFPRKFMQISKIVAKIKPTPENTVIQYDFELPQTPEDAKLIPFIDLPPQACKWICEGFWEEPSSQSLCCGKAVVNIIGTPMQRNYCMLHYKASIEERV